jgi:structural maintenance of chromosome 2
MNSKNWIWSSRLKKQAVADADLQLKKLEHDLQTLNKEKAASSNFVSNLEKQYEWIAEESEWVEIDILW